MLYTEILEQGSPSEMGWTGRTDMCGNDVMDQADAFIDALAERKILLSFHRSECDTGTVPLSR